MRAISFVRQRTFWLGAALRIIAGAALYALEYLWLSVYLCVGRYRVSGRMHLPLSGRTTDQLLSIRPRCTPSGSREPTLFLGRVYTSRALLRRPQLRSASALRAPTRLVACANQRHTFRRRMHGLCSRVLNNGYVSRLTSQRAFSSLLRLEQRRFASPRMPRLGRASLPPTVRVYGPWNLRWLFIKNVWYISEDQLSTYPLSATIPEGRLAAPEACRRDGSWGE